MDYLFKDLKEVLAPQVAKQFGLGSCFIDDSTYTDRFSINLYRRRRVWHIPLPSRKKVLTIEGTIHHIYRTIENIAYRPENPEEIGKQYWDELIRRLNGQQPSQ